MAGVAEQWSGRIGNQVVLSGNSPGKPTIINNTCTGYICSVLDLSTINSDYSIGSKKTAIQILADLSNFSKGVTSKNSYLWSWSGKAFSSVSSGSFIVKGENDKLGVNVLYYQVNITNSKSDTVVPAVPSAVKAVSTGYNTIKVSWNTVSGATKYELYQSTSSTGTYTLLASTASASYTKTGLAAGKTYYYKVRVYRLVGSTKVYSAYSAIVSAKTTLSKSK